mmetsp:Transcript_18479/g.46280  ORF Transcript_18479/g.46280 Transcript_18479/m.46280 type:complete len:204 (-) Transcript_18479:386-997(-)
MLWLLLAPRLPRPLHVRGGVQAKATLSDASSDPLGLDAIRQGILDAVTADTQRTQADAQLVALFGESIAPFEPAVYAPELTLEERARAIRALSQSLDLVEEAVRGPMLTGKSLSIADAHFFPSMCLLHKTLPTHFGWSEWTEEAIFWKRPRLHAWFELMLYEPAARKAERKVAIALSRLRVDWDQIAAPIPTASFRTFARHAL